MPARLRIRGEVPAWLTIHRGTLAEHEVTRLDGLAIVTPARAIIDGIEANVGGVSSTRPGKPPGGGTC